MKSVKDFFAGIENGLADHNTQLYIRKDNEEDKICFATSFGLEWDGYISRLKWTDLKEQEERGILEVYEIGNSVALEWHWPSGKSSRYIFTLKKDIKFKY